MADYKGAEAYILTRLGDELDRTLFYHGLHHVLDVVGASERIALEEGVNDVPALQLLRTAALYHDSGFLVTYNGHEEAGCEIVSTTLPTFGFDEHQIATICGMIMATKVPQTPQNHLEQILCDADLDYLGRADFESIATTLYEEMKCREIVSDIGAWNATQLRFLTAHEYWTESARRARTKNKAANVEQIRRQL